MGNDCVPQGFANGLNGVTLDFLSATISVRSPACAFVGSRARQMDLRPRSPEDFVYGGWEGPTMLRTVKSSCLCACSVRFLSHLRSLRASR